MTNYKPKIDRTGKRFGRLIITEYIDRNYCIAKCDCGTIKKYITCSLITKGTQSCGYWHKEIVGRLNYKHGLTKTRLYKIWQGVKDRCLNKYELTYKYYGARGIIICEEWKNSSENFCFWAHKNGYQDNLTIERKDVNGNYCPENCIWIPLSKQGNNKTNNRKITAFGETKNLNEWAKDSRCLVSRPTITRRIKDGMSPEEAMTSPIRKNQYE